MKAVIVAAGVSSRLYPLTLKTPKPLLEIDGSTVIESSIEALRKNGIKDIGVVVGYLKEQFCRALKGKVAFIDNPLYAFSNDLASFYCSRDFAGGDDLLYLHGDLIYHPDILKNSIREGGDIVLAVDKKACDEEDMKVRVENGLVVESSKEIPLHKAYGEWIGIARFSKEAARLFFDEAYSVLSKGNINAYDTYAFTALAGKGQEIKICNTGGLPWVEIDFSEELERARKIFHQHDKHIL